MAAGEVLRPAWSPLKEEEGVSEPRDVSGLLEAGKKKKKKTEKGAVLMVFRNNGVLRG